MPWNVVKRSGPRPWKIVKTDTGEVVGSSTSRIKAEASVRARYSSVKGEARKRDIAVYKKKKLTRKKKKR